MLLIEASRALKDYLRSRGIEHVDSEIMTFDILMIMYKVSNGLEVSVDRLKQGIVQYVKLEGSAD